MSEIYLKVNKFQISFLFLLLFIKELQVHLKNESYDVLFMNLIY